MKAATICTFLATGAAVQAVPIALSDMNNFSVQPVLALMARADSTITAAPNSFTGQSDSTHGCLIKDKRADTTTTAAPTSFTGQSDSADGWLIKDKRADRTDTTTTAAPTSTGQSNSTHGWLIKDKRADGTESANTPASVSEKVFEIIKRDDSTGFADTIAHVSEKVFEIIKRSTAPYLNSTSPTGASDISTEDGSWLFIPNKFTGGDDLNMTVAHNGTLAHSVHVSMNVFWLV